MEEGRNENLKFVLKSEFARSIGINWKTVLNRFKDIDKTLTDYNKKSKVLTPGQMAIIKAHILK